MLALVASLALSAFVFQNAEKPEEKEMPKKANPIAVIKTNQGEIEVELFQDETPETVANFLGLAEGTKEFVDSKTHQKVKRPFFDGLIFHRVIKDFMIQGGCPLGNGAGDPGYRFKDEISATSLGLDKEKAFNEQGQPHQHLMLRSQQEFQQQILMPLLKEMNIGSQDELNKKQKEVQERLQKLTLAECYTMMGYMYDNKLKSHPPKKGVLAMANSGPGTNGSQFFINLADTPWLTGKHTVFGQVVKGMDIVEKIGGVKVGAQDKPEEDVKIESIRQKK